MNSHEAHGSEHVVVGYDGSAPSAVAVDWAAAEARRRGVPLTVVHVVDDLGIVPGQLPQRMAPLRATAMRIAAEGVERARKVDDGLEATAQTLIARVAPALVEASKNASLVVVGTRGRGEVTAALLGSVAFRVSEHAHCPTVVVPGSAGALPGPDRPVVAGVDTWPRSEPAVSFAAGIASETSAPLELVCAYRAAYPGMGDPTTWWALEAEGEVQFERLAREAALETVVAASQAMRDRFVGLNVHTFAPEGPPARVLAEKAKGCGLLVIGARGSGGFAGLRLGSVAHAVLHDAPAPVAVVRSDDEEVTRAL
ncbi:MAG: universal stress protein [Kineosporiaceae bacterium]